jgi:hypothetical protein
MIQNRAFEAILREAPSCASQLVRLIEGRAAIICHLTLD